MKATEADHIADSYFRLLRSLSPVNKLALIEKLSKSVKNQLKVSRTTLKSAFGAFDSEDSADNIVEDIRTSRHFIRSTESFD
jgi:hypothetical protein